MICCSCRQLLDRSKIAANAKDANGRTCAHRAAQYGRIECIKLILGGANLRACLALCSEKDNDGNTVLHMAVLMNDNDIALWLLRRFGSSIANLPNNDIVLPLHIAAGQGCFCNFGQVFAQNPKYVSIDHISLVIGNIEFLRIATTYDGYMVNQRDKNGKR